MPPLLTGEFRENQGTHTSFLPLAPCLPRMQNPPGEFLDACYEGRIAKRSPGSRVSAEELTFERVVGQKDSPVVDLLQERGLLGQGIMGFLPDQPSGT
jgi:hypothetical protein